MTATRLIDVKAGDRVLGIGVVESASTERGVTTLQARNAADKAVRTWIWKADQLVDVRNEDDEAL